uniref:Uncharacterized protein n=1 Tax=Corethron hystrix TaxID=216773 RepID=A0A7S1B2K4_9STRA
MNSVLHLAAKEGNLAATEELVKVGMPVNLVNAKGMTPLAYACQQGYQPIVSLLLSHGANPKTNTGSRSTPLIQAAHFGHTSICSLLLSAGVDPNQCNDNRTTALMRASQEGHVEVARLLIYRGALVSTDNRDKMTSIMLASQRGHADLVKTLIQAGADTDGRTKEGSTPLILACKRGKVEVVRALLAAGCELTLRDGRERTAHDTAVRNGMGDVAALLHPQVQEYLMQVEERKERSYVFCKMWNLMQMDRATLTLWPITGHPFQPAESFFTLQQMVQAVHTKDTDDTPQHKPKIKAKFLNTIQPYSFAMAVSMMLPHPLMEHISGYVVHPNLFEKRLTKLGHRRQHCTQQAVSDTLDLLDEVLFEGGFPEACDLSQIKPPPKFQTWRHWVSWVRCGTSPLVNVSPSPATCVPDRDETDTNSDTEITDQINDALAPTTAASFHKLFGKKHALYLLHRLAAHASRSSLQFFRLVLQHPKLYDVLATQFHVPVGHLDRLMLNFDVQSLARRYPLCTFESILAEDMFQLAYGFVMWYNCHHSWIVQPNALTRIAVDATSRPTREGGG